jgi:NAD(P)H-dependent flavin oxidoreductase YrpB (nitropropane dioxygenase family)
VTTKVDGMPHRVLRTDLVDALERSGRVRGLAQAARNTLRFRTLTGVSWRALAREGLAMKRSGERTWSQLMMAANTPMLLRAGLVEGNTEAGVLASGQVVGMLDDLPSVAELIDGIVADAERRIDDLQKLR